MRTLHREILRCFWSVVTALILAVGLTVVAHAQSKKPNIFVWGDDVGWSNVGAYNMGMMGNQTPNIDWIAKEGMRFTYWYAQQSCTAGRAAFIIGQHPFRTGLLTVGLPGASRGLQPEDQTIADQLKEQGYMTGQFGDLAIEFSGCLSYRPFINSPYYPFRSRCGRGREHLIAGLC